MMRTAVLCLVLAVAGTGAASSQDRTPAPTTGFGIECGALGGAAAGRRVVCADVVALDQMLVYNRFGSYNPFGMIFALRRDVVPLSIDPKRTTADECDQSDGTRSLGGDLAAGEVRLKDCKRPRPLTLRANAGDVLHLRVTNLLRTEQPGFSETFCRRAGDPDRGPLFGTVRDWVSSGSDTDVKHDNAACETRDAEQSPDGANPGDGDWPRTRSLNIAIQGLELAAGPDGGINPVCKGLASIAPGGMADCYYLVDREGPYFMSSTAAPAGGEGDGGSITHGLFGAVIAEPESSRWYRSQVTAGDFGKLWAPKADGPRHAVELPPLVPDPEAPTDAPIEPYDTAEMDGVPILHMLDQRGPGAFELVHSDLNAIVRRIDQTGPGSAFREFSVFFHDELKTFYTRNFSELGEFGEGQLAGVRDGFAINYGAGGMGATLLANRKGIGPAANCAECQYEEFFLTSWANGDPALLEQFPDDPSNVHHSYLNDAVVFRNFHAGPKETHVFHLHAHQWFAGNDANRGAYLDSQTVAPQQGFTYNIYGGGLRAYHRGENGAPGWYESLGAGNRNRTIGDSIFHCHLYPHFAQGMWELWRVHDVLEDGTRKLPDGQKEPGLSLAEMDEATRAEKRPGSVDPDTGVWTSGGSELGTPIPAVVPLPGQPWPMLPSYAAEPEAETAAEAGTIDAMPGFPFYVAGRPGHRPPQAPGDIARDLGNAGGYLDGGLPRHVVGDAAERKPNFPLPEDFLEQFAKPGIETLADALRDPDVAKREARQRQVIAKALAMGDMTVHLESAELELLPYEGTKLERAAMAFHHDGAQRLPADDEARLTLAAADGEPARYDGAAGGYVADTGAMAGLGAFAVNGAPPKPGAPFADPCGAPDAGAGIVRTEEGYKFNGRELMVVREDGPADPAPSDLIRAEDRHLSNWVRNWTTPPVPLFYVDANRDVQRFDYEIRVISEDDPFLPGETFTTDPGVVGFRRYEASAVQLDLVTNRAGWHDPQARINVLTTNSPDYKDGGARLRDARFSPKISGQEEPFFFRALSGECIEFRHTNELPKELELDDFQVRTPTDTIGQHIHLVKFDVTSSDGSGNGFNYEDGTFAADEIAARICAAKSARQATEADRGAGDLVLREMPGLCVEVEEEPGHWVASDEFKDIWRRPLTAGRNRDLFQTTTQRWFADPILSPLRAEGDTGAGPLVDRTLRTVFSHDHFGPSSIQQHGFYTALVIEPQGSQTCDPDGTGCSLGRTDRALIDADERDVGATKAIVDWDAFARKAPDEGTYREFALAVADFATLYDPRDQTTEAEIDAAFALNRGAGDGESALAKGMAMLLCEARYAADANPRKLRDICGSGLGRDPAGWFSPAGDRSPAWVAAGMPGDNSPLARALTDNLITPEDLAKLKEHLVGYRRQAAGFDTGDTTGGLASPVAGPKRPESISVDHHDPYLLNYRGEPIPLRIGRTDSGCELEDLSTWEERLATGVAQRCSLVRQERGPGGDLAFAFATAQNGDPVTGARISYSGDRVLFRLIQGAQEVQHVFTLEGYTWPRNIDQRFPSAAPKLSDKSARDTLVASCADAEFTGGGGIARGGRADQYENWRRNGPDYFGEDDKAYWREYEAQLAACYNAEGRIAAQEVGISEHFEFAGTYRNDITTEGTPVAPAITLDFMPTDTLQHFGTTDSLWNGAWSLPRVYKDKEGLAPEAIFTCLGSAEEAEQCLRRRWEDEANRAGEMVLPLEEIKDKAGEANPALRAATGGTEGTEGGIFVNTTVIGCDPYAPVVHAAVVAIEAETVFGRNRVVDDLGVDYADNLYDRNGLFLALVDPLAVANGARPGETLAEELARGDGIVLGDRLAAPESWTDVPLPRVLGAIREGYTEPRPLVLPVRAGECVRLTVLNALHDWRGLGGLKDDLGDAPLPPITPLNVEPGWEREGGPEASVPATYTQKDRVNVRPSSRFALLLPLPTLNHLQRIARPFGLNATGALAGIGMDANAVLTIVNTAPPWAPRTNQIEQLSFYAGRTAAPNDFDPVRAVANPSREILERMDKLLVSLLGASAVGMSLDEVKETAEPDAGDLPFMGRRFEITVTIEGRTEELARILPETAVAGSAEHDAVRRFWSQYTAFTTAEELHFIPHVFGALPIKSGGDLIGHAAHGLIGAVNVLPATATLESDGVERLNEADLQAPRQPASSACDPERGADACQSFLLRPAPASTLHRGLATVVETRGHPRGDHRIRDFTLFWQDGLNLRDTRTRNVFAGRDTGTGGRLWPRLVPECEVCDDSYDLGDQGVGYRSEPFHIRLREGGGPWLERQSELNAVEFPSGFLARAPADNPEDVPVLRAEEGEEVVVHVVDPGGRARQHSFVTIGQDYDDLFPGFGFPHSALIAPGKAVTASLTKRVRTGCYLWYDGTIFLQSGGLWGLLDVVPKGKVDDATITSCARGAVR